MAIQTVNTGTTPNDGTGDPARTAFTKLNSNFTQSENAASKLVATNAQALAGTAGVMPDAAGVHAAFKQFGLGASASAVGTNFAILDSPLTMSGFYEVTANGWTSAPPGNYQYRIIHIRHSNNAGYATQIAFSFNGSRAFIRTATNSLTFGPWRELFHTGNILGTVSQSGGIPTGAIIERGSNANGEYTKFADGTMICFYIAGFTTPNSTEVSVPWTFPSTFIDTAYTSIAQWRGPAPGQAAVFYNNTSHTVNSVTFTATTIDGAVFMAVGVLREAAFVAIGRWY